MWFGLLFFAGITSSVALAQPLVAFLQDEFRVSRRGAALICGLVMLACGLPIVLWLRSGYMDQYDFWVGTLGLAVFSLVEVLIFAWAFGGDAMWSEMQRGADIRIPRPFFYIIRFIVPVYLIVLLVGWTAQSLTDAVLLTGAPREDVPYLWMARASIVGVIVTVAALVGIAWRKKRTTASTKTETGEARA
jgi:neurotransmitter:Na+ symporter, NSS family